MALPVGDAYVTPHQARTGWLKRLLRSTFPQGEGNAFDSEYGTRIPNPQS